MQKKMKKIDREVLLHPKSRKSVFSVRDSLKVLYTVKPLPQEILYLLKYGEIVILVSRTSDFKPRGRGNFFFISPKKSLKKL
jgi:hypothetical protein